MSLVTTSFTIMLRWPDLANQLAKKHVVLLAISLTRPLRQEAKYRIYYPCDDDPDGTFSVIQLLGRLYQVVNGSPDFEVETKDNTFWVPILPIVLAVPHMLI